MYKAKNVDTDKALEYINDSRRYQEQAKTLNITSSQKYYEGIEKGLDIAEEIFTCCYCESKTGTYQDGALDVICKLGKELDVPNQDIIEGGGSVEDMCVTLAQRIKGVIAKEVKP